MHICAVNIDIVKPAVRYFPITVSDAWVCEGVQNSAHHIAVQYHSGTIHLSAVNNIQKLDKP